MSTEEACQIIDEMSISEEIGSASQPSSQSAAANPTNISASAAASDASFFSSPSKSIKTSPPLKGETAVTGSKKGKVKPAAAAPTPSAAASAAADADAAASLDNGAFQNILSGRIAELEGVMTGPSGNAERESAKVRRKLLREVLKQVADRSRPAEERLEQLQSRFATQVSELLRMDKQLFEERRDLEVANREKDRVQSELRRTHALKDRLEDLCRQLQKEAKEVGEASRRQQAEEQKQRRELEARFSSAIKDVSVRMDEQQTERERQQRENESLRGKLEEVVKQFDAFQQLLSKKDLEVQLHQARCEQQEALAAQLRAQAAALEKANQLLKREAETGHQAAGENAELRGQLQNYLEKFEDIQGTLGKSNKMFDRLRAEVNEHQRLRQTLAVERDELRRRCEVLEAAALLRKKEGRAAKAQIEQLSGLLAAEPAPSAGADDDTVARVRRLKTQKDRLEGLCRMMQQQLKGTSSTPAAAPSETEVDSATEVEAEATTEAEAATEAEAETKAEADRARDVSIDQQSSDSIGGARAEEGQEDSGKAETEDNLLQQKAAETEAADQDVSNTTSSPPLDTTEI